MQQVVDSVDVLLLHSFHLAFQHTFIASLAHECIKHPCTKRQEKHLKTIDLQ